MSNQSRSITSARRGLGSIAAAALLLAACGSEAAIDEGAGASADESANAAETPAPEAGAAEAGTQAGDTEENESPTTTVADVAPVADDIEPLGSGTIVLDGVEYVYQTTFCSSDEDGVFNQGVGVTADGTPFVGEVTLLQVAGIENLSIALRFNQESIYSPPLDFTLPSWSGDSYFSGGDYSYEGNAVSGWVTASDENGATDTGATVRLDAEADCLSDNAPIGTDIDSSAVDGTNYCEIAQLEVNSAAQLDGTALMDPDTFEDYLAFGIDNLARIDRPAEIADDLELIDTSIQDLDALAADADYVFMSLIAAMGETIGNQDVINAGVRIQGFNEAACGIEGPNQ